VYEVFSSHFSLVMYRHRKKEGKLISFRDKECEYEASNQEHNRAIQQQWRLSLKFIQDCKDILPKPLLIQIDGEFLPPHLPLHQFNLLPYILHDIQQLQRENHERLHAALRPTNQEHLGLRIKDYIWL